MRRILRRPSSRLAAIAAAALAFCWAAAAWPREADGQAASPPHRYNDLRRCRSDKINVLAEIPGLAEACAADLAALRERAGVTDKGPPADEPDQVRFYTGVGHVQHGLLPVGRNAPDVDPAAFPPADRWYAEHHLDAAGRLLAVFAHPPGGGLRLTDKLVYDGCNIVARLTYSAEGFRFGDYGLYRDGRLCLVARIGAEGSLYSYECVLWSAGREDYTVRYVRAGDGADPDRMVLQSIELAGGTRIMFDADGGASAVWALHP